MICAWAAPPTRMLSGLRAYQGVYAHIQGLPFERITRAASPEPRPGAPTRAQQKGQDLTKAYMSTHLRSCRCKREQFALAGAPKTQTTSPETVLFHRFSARWSAFWAPRPSDSLRGGGELRHARVRHAGDTPTQHLAWRKTPTPSPASGTTAPDREARSPRNSGRVRHQLTMVRPNSEPPKAREHRRPRGNVLSTARTPNGSTRGATV